MTEALSLLRRWVVDYFNRHDGAACADFIAPDYALHIGDVVFAGRDDQWLPAVDQQMKAFPGLGMTVHQTVTGEGWAAAWFSEHGMSEGRSAVWSGVAIYCAAGGVLTGCVAQEDYMTRRRQIKSGIVDPVDPPAPAPWDTPAQPRNSAAEAVVLEWLSGDWPRGETSVIVDDEHLTQASLHFTVEDCETCEILSSGEDVVFNVRQRGNYLSGLPEPATGPVPTTLDCNGILRVVDGKIVSGRVIRDRMGLWGRVRGPK